MTKPSRTQKVANDAASSYVRMGLGFFVTLAITRESFQVLEQGHYGLSKNQLFGILSLIVAVSGATEFLEDGAATAFIRLLAQRLDGSAARVRQAFSSGWALSVLGGLGRALLLAVIIPWAPRWFSLPPEFIPAAKIGLAILAIGQALGGLVAPWNTALLAQERFALSLSRVFLSQLLRLALTFAAPLAPGGPFVGLVLAIKIPDLLTLLPLAAWEAWRDPRWRLNFDAIDRAEVKGLAALGGWRAFQQATWNLFSRADQVICTALLGPAANAAYAVADQVKNQVTSLCSVLNGVLLPVTSKLSSHDDLERIRRVYVFSTRMSLALALGPAVILSFYSADFFRLWLGPGHGDAAAVLPLALAALILRLPIGSSWNLLTAVDRLRQPVITQFFEGLVNQGLSILFILGLGFGLPGVYLGTLAAGLPRLLFWHLPLMAKVLGEPAGRLALQATAAPLAGAAALAALLFFLRGLGLPSGAQAGLAAALCLGYGLWCWFGILENNQRQAIAKLWRRA